MRFEDFINKCIELLEISKNELYFEYHYFPDTTNCTNSYKLGVRGTKYSVWITPEQQVCQFYDKNGDFKNLNSLEECLKELNEVIKKYV